MNGFVTGYTDPGVALGYPEGIQRWLRRLPRRGQSDERHGGRVRRHVQAVQVLAKLSLDAGSWDAYGPVPSTIQF